MNNNIEITTNTGSYTVIFQRVFHENIKDDISYILHNNATQKRILIVTDDIVGDIYIEEISAICKELSNNVYTLTLLHGEHNKTLSSLEKIFEVLTKYNFSRNDILIAFGGGVVGDTVGLAASMYKRGLDYIQIPTTLLSMVDSSVGGKTAVNFHEYKNIIGHFYNPKAVLIYSHLLDTLPFDEVKNGIVEMIKMASLKDKNLFDELVQFSMFYDRSYSIKYKSEIHTTLLKLIKKSIIIKKDFIINDFHDTSIRQYLNFGHTVGHAIENISNFQISHGHAVAIGMIYACNIAIQLLTNPEFSNVLINNHDIFADINITTTIDNINILKRSLLNFYNSIYLTPNLNFDVDVLLEAILQDKKNTTRGINFILPLGFENFKIVNLDFNALHNLLHTL